MAKCTLEKADDNHLLLNICVPSEEYEAALDEYFEKNRDSFEFPGFRKKSITREIAEKLTGHEKFAKPVIDQLVSAAYAEAAKEYEEEIYYIPTLRLEQEGSGLDLLCTGKVQIRAEVKLGDYRGISLSEAEIEKASQDAKAAPPNMYAETRRYLLQSVYIDRIGECTEVEVPETMAQERALQMMNSFRQQVESHGEEMENYYKETGSTEEELMKEFAAQAARQLRSRLALFEIAKEQGLEATEEEYDREIKRYNELYFLPEERIREILGKREGNKLRMDIGISKAADFIGRLVDERYPFE